MLSAPLSEYQAGPWQRNQGLSLIERHLYQQVVNALLVSVSVYHREAGALDPCSGIIGPEQSVS